ncbi:right-handed parallel beta-helix repeat-containing protein [Pedobacter sp. L105]|uniref:glycosyl hydrolase family 28-related protein n=1 Tax=Pedobacter sp. L105 TaxID=1641871 RepID=UPI00131A8A56|nr:right-handed parallel beta-helix repeat-containing protein [Pedobacter sp. L105]
MINTLKAVLLSFIVSFFLLACSKISTNPVEEVPVSAAVATNASVQTYQTYGLVGDGVTDNTAALQKLINASSVIYLKAGTYIINQTINLKAGIKIYGEALTVIKAGPQMSGTLLTNGRYFFGSAADQALIHQLTFGQSDKAFTWSTWNNACIYLLNSKGVTVENSTFNFHLPYNATGMEAVWVSGSGSSANSIKNNKITSLGIKYAENGADGTIVDSNLLTNAYSNALTANGNNATDYSIGCQVLNNTISNSGRMGIEDWGNTDGSVIQGNKISGTGKDPNQAVDGIAISAVGTNVKVISNTVSDSKEYAIEVRGNYGVTVTNNVLTNNPLSTGIILNYTFAVPVKAAAGSVATITGNKIGVSNIGIHVFGDYQANALIKGNVFTNTITKGISIESGAATYTLNITNNKFNFSVPAAADRYGVFSYTKYNPGTANQVINLSTDTLLYSTSAAGGAGVDLGLVIRTDKATINNVQIQGSNNKSAAKVAVNGITAFGAKPIGVKFTNNKVVGAIADLTGFTNYVSTGNNF